MTSGRHLVDVGRHIVFVEWCLPDVILRRSFTRPFTALAVIEGLGMRLHIQMSNHSPSHTHTKIWHSGTGTSQIPINKKCNWGTYIVSTYSRKHVHYAHWNINLGYEQHSKELIALVTTGTHMYMYFSLTPRLLWLEHEHLFTGREPGVFSHVTTT